MPGDLLDRLFELGVVKSFHAIDSCCSGYVLFSERVEDQKFSAVVWPIARFAFP
jgi:hypothetical protein